MRKTQRSTGESCIKGGMLVPTVTLKSAQSRKTRQRVNVVSNLATLLTERNPHSSKILRPRYAAQALDPQQLKIIASRLRRIIRMRLSQTTTPRYLIASSIR